MHRLFRLLAALSLVCAVSFILLSRQWTYGSVTHLANRFDQMSSSTAGATATHLFGFGITDTSQPLGSIEFQFCSNDPIPTLPCTAPTGFDASGAVLANQTGNTGFSMSAAPTSNEIILTRVTSIPTTTANTYQFDNVINPTTADTFYVRVYIFASSDASGTDTQDGGIAAAINSAVSVNAEVPPYLKFCAGDTITNFDCATATTFFVDLGDFSNSQPSTGSSQFVVATNAQSGLNVTLSGMTLTSGNNTVPAMTTTATSQTGVSQFGLNLRANTNPAVGADSQGPGTASISARYNIPDEFSFGNGDQLISTLTSNDNQKLTVSYVTNVNSSQASGVYVTTLTYICLANF